jgi:S-adenosylmethionine:tRNA ribosyltransferase-isomerase
MDALDEHRMHSEWGEITAATAEELNAARASKGRIIAVGTTVARLLETAVRAGSHPDGTRQGAGSKPRALISDSSLPAPRSKLIPAWQGNTELFIRAPFEFLAIDALLTNFHFPRTTLLLLVQTFGGWELIAEAYQQAIRDEYRFYSYGDAMLIV